MHTETSARHILRPSRSKSIVLLAVSLFLLLGGIGMRHDSPILAWCTVAFFGLCALVALSKLLPQAAYLELRPEGFIICELFRRSSLFAWENVSEFTTARLPTAPQLFVVFDELPPRTPKLGSKNKALFGFTSALPDTYGHSAEKLAEVLTSWRTRRMNELHDQPRLEDEPWVSPDGGV